MNNFQSLTDASNHLYRSSAGSFNGCQEITLWLWSTEAKPISSLTVQETADTLFLIVEIPDLHQVILSLQVTAEIVLLRGQPHESAIVEGYFRPREFETRIPLPHWVHPETCSTKIRDNTLIIQLEKQLNFQLPKFILLPQ